MYYDQRLLYRGNPVALRAGNAEKSWCHRYAEKPNWLISGAAGVLFHQPIFVLFALGLVPRSSLLRLGLGVGAGLSRDGLNESRRKAAPTIFCNAPEIAEPTTQLDPRGDQ